AICRESGLAAPEGERQLYTLTSVGRDWLFWDSDTQLKVLFDAWFGGATWAEMYIECLMRNNEYRQRDAIVHARNSVLQMVAESPVSDAYISFESVASALTYRFPMLLADCSA